MFVNIVVLLNIFVIYFAHLKMYLMTAPLGDNFNV